MQNTLIKIPMISNYNTVNRIVNSFYKYHLPNFNYLPKKLCFDEFRSVKECFGAISFVFCDAESHKIIDILEDRRLNQLRNYFSKYSQKAKISSHYMLTSIKTYIKYLAYIKNSLNYPFSNGPIEGINNKIKVMRGSHLDTKVFTI